MSPKSDLLSKLFIYVPESHLDILKDALFASGAGQIAKYSECSFSSQGTGTFKPGKESQPFIGSTEERTSINEIKLEVLVPRNIVRNVLTQAKIVHPYEEMAYEIVGLSNEHQEIGSGVIGSLSEEMSTEGFLTYVKEKLNLQVIRHTKGPNKIRKIAVCGGSGSFLIKDAIRSGADAYITSDIKYHEFFDAEDRVVLCDVGHYESEISTLEIFYDRIQEKFPNFAVIFCTLSTNPIQYFK
ncbi:MAG: Nif3-like dinuclear metal center hexameric protein [Bacteroidia bacterium]|nr:Nif3-like dinuclear metal center hexameric protein [Bacteroidia bacterium]